MCGLVGIWSPGGDPEALVRTARAMRDALAHRGPDDAGLWADPAAGLVLGHRRLSILDPSPEGHQPMLSASGRFAMVFNGEVYNHLELRPELGERWRGTSDTETMLAAIEVWGLEAAVRRFVGMFAIALWDRRERTLSLVRDRLGIKPLAWGRTADGSLVFGSELRALAHHPRLDTSVDPAAVRAYFEESCVPAPLSIWRSVRKQRPGTILTFGGPGDGRAETAYWDAREVYARGAGSPLEVGAGEAAERVREILESAVSLRLLSDVPLGAFLSGGVDSSLVTAVARRLGGPLRTFSIGNAEAAYDESQAAAEVAARLGTIHTARTIDAGDALAIVPTLGGLYDEPFADSSQIPTLLVSRVARAEVTVALSGDGGDEVFGGYNRHRWGPRLHRVSGRLPRAVRVALAGALEGVSRSRWDALHAGARPWVPDVRLAGDKVHKLARALRADTLEGSYAALRRQWDPAPVAGPPRPLEPIPAGLGGATALMLRDLLGYLPDDILTKVDRASMAVALEVRVPLLDHRLVELAARLPERHKSAGRGKNVLRALLAREVPGSLFERPKTGFSVPIGSWLRGPLRPWAEDLLAPAGLRELGLDEALVGERWREHRGGRAEWGTALWDVLMLRAWALGARPAVAPERAEGASPC